MVESIRSAASALRVFAAGSLRDVLTTAIAAHRVAGGAAVDIVFGPSGKLRERIETGDVPDLFAAAAVAHTQTLVRNGVFVDSLRLARNAMCLLLRPGLRIDPDGFVDALLDPALTIGTSTPGADPSGDYAWLVFQKIDAERPGALAILEAKAKQLVGAEVDPQQAQAPQYSRLLVEERSADAFLTYCTGTQAAVRDNPEMTSMRVPDKFNVAAEYGIGIARGAHPEAEPFLRFLLSAEGRRIFARFGFD
jgi:ABC-type molybdate transport system substrate-binding protein